MMKKLFLILMFILISVSAAQAFNLFGKKDVEFRFEDYKTEKLVTEALVKLHSLGSDYNQLVKTLEVAGAECQKDQAHQDIISCRYKYGFMNWWFWEILVKFDSENKILNIWSKNEYRGL